MNNPFVFIIFLYIAQIARVLGYGRKGFKYTIITGSVLILFAIYCAMRMKEGGLNKEYVLKVKPLVTFNISILMLQIIWFMFYDPKVLSIGVACSLLFTYAYSLVIIIFLGFKSSEHIKVFLDKTFILIGIVFCVQLLCSSYESFSGSYLFECDSYMYNTLKQFLYFQNKIILPVVGVKYDFSSIFGLPFCGLLGGANFWAPQLVLYNLIFIIMYHQKKGIFWIINIALVLIAVIFNGTRAGIFTILATDIIYLFSLEAKGKGIKILSLSAFGFILFNYLQQIIANFLIYFSQTDTLTRRFDYYGYFITYIRDNIWQCVVGFPYETYSQLGYYLRSGAGYEGASFESAFFQLIFLYGFIGLSVYVIFLINTLLRGVKSRSKSNKIFAMLLILSIMGVSLTIGGVLGPYYFQFATLIYIYIFVVDLEQEPESKNKHAQRLCIK